MSRAVPAFQPVLCGMCGICAVCLCGIKPACFLACAVCAVSALTRAGACMQAGAYAGAHMRTHAHPHSYRTYRTYRTQPLFARVSHFCNTALHTPHTAQKEMKDWMTEETHARTIRCTPENAAQMQKAVKAWPELHALVQSLQAQNLFPGLRGLQITVTGSAEHVAKGLGALIPENAPNGPKTEAAPTGNLNQGAQA